MGVTMAGLVAVDIRSDDRGISRLLERMGFGEFIQEDVKVQPILAQIGEYLAGQRRDFDFPIHWSVMTPFQQQSLQATYAIPYGQTVTYGEIARRIGRPRSARAVGRAQATNPMPLVIPCHRVLGADGGLHGYGAGEGLATKAWLLKLEAGTFAK